MPFFMLVREQRMEILNNFNVSKTFTTSTNQGRGTFLIDEKNPNLP